jgi:PAS domain S-box-containing protein
MNGNRDAAKRADQMQDLSRRLAEAEAALQALTAGQVNAVVDPISGTPTILHQIQAALHESEAYLPLILEQLPAIVWTTDSELRYTSAWGSGLGAIGMHPEQLVGMSLYDYPQTDENVLADIAAHRRALKGEQVAYDSEWGEQTFQACVKPLRDAEGGITGCLGVALNITQRAQAEKALRQAHAELEIRVQARTAELVQANEALQVAEEQLRDQVEELTDSRQLIEVEWQRYQDLFEFAPDGYLVTDPKGIIREANRAMAALLHMPQDSLVAKPFMVFVTQEDRKTLVAQLLQLQMGEEKCCVTWEARLQPRPGDSFHAALTVGPVYDAEGNLISLRWLIRDITQRIQVEEERERLLAQVEQQRQWAEELANSLKKKRDTLQTIMENTHAQLAYLDSQFNFVRVNSAYVQGSGHSREELMGRNHFELFPNLEYQAIFERVRETGEPVAFHAKPFEYADQPERGTTYWDWTLVPVKDGDGHVQGLVFSLLDVTERKWAEEDLQNVLEETRQREAEISALLEGARAVLAYRNFEDIARLIFDSCKNLLGAKAGYIALLAENGIDNEVVFLDPGGLPCLVNPTLPMPIRGLRETAYQSGKTVYENDFPTSEWLKFLPKGHAHLNNVLFAPLLIKGIAVGLLGIANKAGGFTENDARMASAFAEIVAIALFNSQTLESLEKSEERFRSVAQTACEAIITADSMGKIVFWNKAAATIFGYTADEAFGMPLTCIMPERFRAIHQKGVERLISTGKPQIAGKTVEMIGLRKGGHEFPMEISLSTWKIGEEMFFTGIIHDIIDRKQAEEALRRAHDELERRVQERTAALAKANQVLQAEIAERKQTEEELRSSEERFRQLAENIRETFWITDPKMNQMLYVSRAYEEIWGRTCQSLYEQPDSYLDAIHPEDRERVIATLEKQALGSYDEQYRIVRPDGAVRWIRTRAFPVRNERSEVYRIAGISEDVSERALAFQILEQRVQERTRELSTLLEASHTMASTLDMEPLLGLILDQLKTVVDCSGATIYYLEAADLKTLAYRGPISQKEALEMCFPLENVPGYHEMIRHRTPIIIPDVRHDTPLARVFQELVGNRLNTTFGYIRSWMGVPLTVQERVIGMLSLHHSQPDYYTTGHAELALAFANQAAMAMENARLYEQAQELAVMQERQRLSRDLHDSVSQALFSASLSAEVLPRLWERNPDKAQLCLEELHQLTRGALAEMRTLLLELRPEALTQRDLGDLLRQLTEAVTNRVRVPVTLTVEGRSPLPPEVQVAIYRIAQEALNNVTKHAGASQVAVSLRYPSLDREEEGAGVELCISDDGQGFNLDGISPQHLGLGIMRERAEAIGATLEIESQKGHGTRIAVVWMGRANDEGRRTKDEG